MKQSLDLSGSMIKQMEKLMGTFKVPGSSEKGLTPGAGIINDLKQLNQSTLSSLEMFRQWETALGNLKLFLGAFPGLTVTKDDQYRKMGDKITALKKRLDDQESLIKELQSKLAPESVKEEDSGDAVQILSDFFTAQNEQFQRLLAKSDPL